MNDELTNLQQSFEKKISSAVSLDELESISLELFGRKGVFNSFFARFKDNDSNDLKAIGQELNKTKNALLTTVEKRKNQILRDNQDHSIDVTLPGKKVPAGSIHMVRTAIEEIANIFHGLGFIRMSYPEVEWEHFSFDCLNMPPDHPARDDFETFFINTHPHKKYGKMLLTPHTSSGQIREMMRVQKPPIKMINIAKTYRPNWDATHVPMFHQFEGLVIDKNITIAHLKGTIEYFVHRFFGSDRKTRLRPFHFQFTEPSFEVDIECNICKGTGMVSDSTCKVCKSGWMELGGSGMVHPNVLTAGGIDPEEFSGWAFGFGIERVYMMKQHLKLDDLRIIYNGDIRFLSQF